MNTQLSDDKPDIYNLEKRLDNTEIAVGLIMAELSKHIDTEKVLADAHLKAQDRLYPLQVGQIINKMKLAMTTAQHLA